MIYFTSWQQAHKHLTFCVIAHIVVKTSPLVIMEIFFHLISDKTGVSSENAFCNLISAALKKRKINHINLSLTKNLDMGGLNLFSFYYKIVQKCNSLEQYFNFAFEFVAHNQGQLLSFIGT